MAEKEMKNDMHLLIYGHAFPNAVEPGRGIFVSQLLALLPDNIDYRVVAPVPWFLSRRRGRKATVIPKQEVMQIGSRLITVYRPRFLLLPANLLRPLIGWLEYITTLQTVRQINSTWKINLVHVNFAYPDGIACRYICRTLNLKYLVTEHMGAIGNLLSNPGLSSQLVDVYQSAQKIIVVSEAIAKTIKDKVNSSTRIEVIPNSIDMTHYQIRKTNDALHNLIFIGNLIETKGIHILIKALALLKEKDCILHLTIVGDGKYLPDLQTLTASLQLQKEVCFTGWKTPEEIAELLSQQDMLVLPSFRESFGIVLIEAMASGLPVISTKCGGPQEIVTPETGILVEPDIVQDLATGIEYMINHFQDYKPEIIRNYCNEHFACTTLLPRLLHIYRAESNHIRVCHFTSVHVRTDVRILVKQCLGLVQHGYKVHLVVADGKGDEVWQGVCIHDIGSSPNRLVRMVRNPLLMLAKVLSLRCDILHFHDPELLPIALILKKITHSKVIYDAHEDYYGAFLYKPYLNQLFRPLIAKIISVMEHYVGSKMDYIITATDHIRELLKDVNPQIETINNYPKLSEWKFESVSEVIKSPRTICYIGNITEVRGITNLIKAMDQVEGILLLAGGFEPPCYRDELIKLPGWRKVKEFGYVNRKEAAEIITQSSVGVVTFLPEPNHLYALSTKLFEYMAGGIAVVASNFPVWKDIIETTGSGICVDPLNIEQIASTLNNLIKNHEVTLEMGKRGRELTVSKFNWEAEESKLIAIYDGLAQKNG